MNIATAVGSFAVVAGLLTIIPGLDTAMVLRAAISGGNRQGFLTALGVGTGALVWGIAAAVGISALLTASALAFTLLRIVGAAYMLWLGGRMVWSAVGRRYPKPLAAGGDSVGDAILAGINQVPAERVPAATAGWICWRQGLFTNLLNPKVGAFYVSLLPQFIPAHADPLLMGALLALVHDAEGMLWFSLIILATRHIRGWLLRREVRRAIDGVTGTVLVGFGVKLGLFSQ